jgi:hypothetical protein
MSSRLIRTLQQHRWALLLVMLVWLFLLRSRFVSLVESRSCKAIRWQWQELLVPSPPLLASFVSALLSRWSKALRFRQSHSLLGWLFSSLQGLGVVIPMDGYGTTPLSTARVCPPGDVCCMLVVLIELVMCTTIPFILLYSFAQKSMFFYYPSCVGCASPLVTLMYPDQCQPARVDKSLVL